MQRLRLWTSRGSLRFCSPDTLSTCGCRPKWVAITLRPGVELSSQVSSMHIPRGDLFGCSGGGPGRTVDARLLHWASCMLLLLAREGHARPCQPVWDTLRGRPCHLFFGEEIHALASTTGGGQGPYRARVNEETFRTRGSWRDIRNYFMCFVRTGPRVGRIGIRMTRCMSYLSSAGAGSAGAGSEFRCYGGLSSMCAKHVCLS